MVAEPHMVRGTPDEADSTGNTREILYPYGFFVRGIAEE